jgi:hypothetical protein
MALRDPFAVYNATTNLEAHVICDLLRDAGLEAFVTEDLSVVGGWVGGLIPEIHKPQVWVERTEAGRAHPVLEAYEQRQAERRNTDPGDRTCIEPVCEEWGKSSMFAMSQRGSVQLCPLCGKYMDVGGPDELPELDEDDDVETE